jgi:TolB-like protein
MLETAVETVIDGVATTTINGARADEVRAELQRILTSRAFVNSHRIRRFLQFVVEECLTGQRHRLKEYLIGLNVFVRRDAFDPRVDSIVRVEARRLRSKLEGYYQTEGRDNQMRIVLHKGSYVPVFEDRSGRASVPGSRPQRRAIAIARFTVPNPSAETSHLVEEIKRRLAHILIKEGNFQVVAQAQRAAAAGDPESENDISGMPKPDYIIEGSVEIHGARLHVIVQVLNTMDSSYVWSETAECDVEDLSHLEELARSLTHELQGPRL